MAKPFDPASRRPAIRRTVLVLVVIAVALYGLLFVRAIVLS